MTDQTKVQDQAWRVVVSAHASPLSPPVIYDHELASMALFLGIRIYSRPSFYEIRFAVIAPDMAAAMAIAAECWDVASASLPLPSWEPHRVTVERVTPPMAPLLQIVRSTNRPGPGIASAEVDVFA